MEAGDKVKAGDCIRVAWKHSTRAVVPSVPHVHTWADMFLIPQDESLYVPRDFSILGPDWKANRDRQKPLGIWEFGSPVSRAV